VLEKTTVYNECIAETSGNVFPRRGKKSFRAYRTSQCYRLGNGRPAESEYGDVVASVDVPPVWVYVHGRCGDGFEVVQGL
jgi:hypothetical protein